MQKKREREKQIFTYHTVKEKCLVLHCTSSDYEETGFHMLLERVQIAQCFFWKKIQKQQNFKHTCLHLKNSRLGIYPGDVFEHLYNANAHRSSFQPVFYCKIPEVASMSINRSHIHIMG